MSSHSIYDMKKQRGLHLLLTILFALAVCCFFGVLYPHHLHFQEQYQLFLFDAGYAADVLSVPGGLADYVGRFLTQFFIYAWLGAALLALLIVLVQVTLSRGMRDSRFYALTFLPALFLWRMMLDENALPGAIVAILLCLWINAGVRHCTSPVMQAVLAVVGLPTLYWLAGPVALWLYTGLMLVLLLPTRRWGLVAAAGVPMLLLALALPDIARRMVAIDPDKLTYGVHYYRYAVHSAWPLWTAVALTLLVRLLAWLEQRMQRRPISPLLPTLLIWAAVGGPLLWMGYNPASEEVMAYDFMARTQQWNRILLTGRDKAPENPTSATVHNLAMGMKGQLAERMFEFPQRGTSGLLPNFVRDSFSPLATSEAFYQLGMINTAQQFVFEAQEAIPDYQKSGRCYKRLAETNLINGAYDVARKYLLTLRKTWFYRAWANETLQLLGNEEAINRHPEYGRLRQMNIQASFFFSDRELPQMLGQLLMCNRKNRLAFDYLEATYLLTGQIDNFAQCYSLGSETGYMTIPTVYQQALLLFWSRDHAASEQLPAGFRPDVVKAMHQFYADLQSKRLSADQVREKWGKTYWYYYFYEK